MESLKQRYIKQRNAQKLNNNWLWEYYKQEGGKLEDPQVFIDNFYFHITRMDINGEIFEQKHNRDLSDFFSNMDKKFGLSTLWGKDGEFIKVVE